MILFAAGRGEALKRFLVEEGTGRDQRLWSLVQALSALYPSHTDEMRWVDGVLARKKSFGYSAGVRYGHLEGRYARQRVSRAPSRAGRVRPGHADRGSRAIEGLARLVERETDFGTAVSHLFILGDPKGTKIYCCSESR
jgi:hypothetical protein